MRRRRLKKLVKRLHELRQQKLTRDQLLIKLGAAEEAGPAGLADHRAKGYPGEGPDRRTRDVRLSLELAEPARGPPPRRELPAAVELDRRRSAQLWAFYLQLTEVEQAFKELKGDLAIRPTLPSDR